MSQHRSTHPGASYVNAHRLAISSGVAHLLVCSGMAVFTHTWLLVWMVGVPAVTFPAYLALRYPDALLSRLAMSAGFMMLTGLIIQQSRGDMEAHYSFAVMMSILVVYCDWRPIALAPAIILAHHAVFTLLQPADIGFHIWSDQRDGWSHVAVHVFVGTLQAGALIYLATMLKHRRILQLQNSALDQSLRRISEEASRDALTGLYNRRHLDGLIDELEARVSNGDEVVTMFVMDIDRFKRINDRYGHLVGDVVLKTVAAILQTSLDHADYAVRCGGEEFIAILRGKTAAEARVIADDVRRRIEVSPVVTAGLALSTTVSIGLAPWLSHESFDSSFARADRGLYKAKNGGRNRVEDGGEDAHLVSGTPLKLVSSASA